MILFLGPLYGLMTVMSVFLLMQQLNNSAQCSRTMIMSMRLFPHGKRWNSELECGIHVSWRKMAMVKVTPSMARILRSTTDVDMKEKEGEQLTTAATSVLVFHFLLLLHNNNNGTTSLQVHKWPQRK
jgi:hypothetical protein